MPHKQWSYPKEIEEEWEMIEIKTSEFLERLENEENIYGIYFEENNKKGKSKLTGIKGNISKIS